MENLTRFLPVLAEFIRRTGVNFFANLTEIRRFNIFQSMLSTRFGVLNCRTGADFEIFFLFNNHSLDICIAKYINNCSFSIAACGIAFWWFFYRIFQCFLQRRISLGWFFIARNWWESWMRSLTGPLWAQDFKDPMKKDDIFGGRKNIFWKCAQNFFLQECLAISSNFIRNVCQFCLYEAGL